MSRRSELALVLVAGAVAAASCAGDENADGDGSSSAATGGEGGTAGTSSRSGSGGASATAGAGAVGGLGDGASGGARMVGGSGGKASGGAGGASDAGDAGADPGGGGGTDPDPSFVPGAPRLLSRDSPGKDEDPFVLRASDDFIYVAWFSGQSGNGDIYLSRTRDGVDWSSTVRVSSTLDTDYYPSLFQDSSGVFHAVWFRFPAGGGHSHIVHTRTSDPLSWNPTAENAVTAPTATESDWTPAIAQAESGALVVAFARDGCFPQSEPCFWLHTIASTDGRNWSSPVPLVAPAGHNDHLPYLARFGSTLLAVWNRYDAAATLPWTTTSTDVVSATSTDGSVWTSPSPVSEPDDGVVDVFPASFTDHDGSMRALWLSVSGADGAVLERSLVGLADPEPLADLPASGYSHRVVATPTPGVYLGAWVQGTDPELDVFVRVFER